MKIDVCDPNPCAAPRLCVSDELDYICECPAGRYGQNCQYFEDCGQSDCTGTVRSCQIIPVCVMLFGSIIML